MRFLQLLGSEGFMPHGMCYLWQPGLLWTHVIADLLIGLSYVGISLSLGWLVWWSARERVDRAGPFERLPFWWMFLAFGLFIVACGITHFLAVWNVWNADYWISGGAKVVTAVASLATAVALPPLVPRAIAVVRAARASELRKRELEEAHRDLKEAHDRIRELDELKTRFFANVSHELRTPLTLITGPVERRLGRDDLDPEERRELRIVLRNARTLHKHVDDLLEVSRLEAGGIRPRYARGDLAGLVRRTAASFSGLADDRDVDFVVEAEGELPVELDPDQVERTLLNLLSNAFKFTPAGGTVRVTVDTVDEAGASVARIRVADSGPGVPEDMRDAVFERFRQVEGGPDRAFGGTGLGLTIAREFVTLHGGDVVIGDAPEGGALFTVTLPLGPKTDTGGEAGDAALPDAPGGTAGAGGGHREEGSDDFVPRSRDHVDRVVEALRPPTPAEEPGPEDPDREDAGVVLVVEDNEELGRFVLQSLPDGVRGVLAGDGREALERARETSPDLILSDLMMPGMTGGELLDEVRASPELAPVPFVVLSALAEQDQRIGLLERGANDYLTKPFTPAELEARLRIWLSVARVRRTLQSRVEVREDDLEALAEELADRNRELSVSLEAAEVAREEEALANRARSEFLAVMSHELRTPLSAIIGYADLLLEEIHGPVTEGQRTQLRRLRKSSDHLLGLIEQTLDFSRLDRDELEPRLEEVDVATLLKDLEPIVAPGAARRDLDFVVEGTDRDATVVTDPGRVRQILLNLLTNAVKYTDEGTVRATLAVGDDDVAVRVEDTGIGIAEKHRQKVFEPFWQVDQSATRGAGGVGLGLSISRRLARRLGGDVTYAPREGGGSVFTLHLPRRPDNADPSDLSSSGGV